MGRTYQTRGREGDKNIEEDLGIGMMPHFVKVWTEGHPDSPNYKIKGATDDGRVYVLNVKEWRKNNEKTY